MSDIKKAVHEEVAIIAEPCSESPKFNDAELNWGQRLVLLKHHKRAVFSAFACSSAAVLIGYDLTLIGSIIANADFVQAFGFFDEDLGVWTLPANRQLVWTIIQFVAAMAGALTVGTLSDIFGRRICYYLTIALTLAGTTVELFSPNWKVWVVAKLLMGGAMGFMQGNTPVYVSELSPLRIRGFMLSLFQLWIIVGSFVASCVLEGTSKISGSWSWKAAIVSQYGMATICLAVFALLVPESPYFLINNERMDQAEAALLKMRGSEIDYSVKDDLEEIKRTQEHEKETAGDSPSYLACFKGVDRRRTLLACLPMVMQQFSGFPLCGNYLAYFLTLSGISNAFLITVISVLLSLFAVMVSFFLIEHVGRRPQLLGGVYGMIPCLIGMGILGFVNRGIDANGKGLAAVAILWGMFYYLSLGAIGWVIVGEISSTRLRAKTTSLAAMSNHITNLAWAIAIPYLINTEEANLGPKTGFIFLGPHTLFAILAFFVIPETKNKTFADLDHLFESHTPARRF